MASKKLSSDTSLANSYKLSRGVASVARPSAPTIGTATDGGNGLMSVTFTASTLGPTASSFALTSSSGVTGSGASSPLTLQEVETGTYTYSVGGVNANGTGPSSAASNSVIVASVDSSAYFPIATTTLATSASTFSFTSIPSTYTHLQIRCSAQTARNYAFDDAKLQLNGDTGNNYAHHRFYGDGQGNNGVASATTTNMIYGPFLGAAGSQSNAFGSTIIDILDYANTSKYKTVRIITGQNSNGASTGSGISSFISGLWMNTNAITSILIGGNSGVNINAKSVFTLYGIKG